jgi:hypothetical protein
LAWSSASSAFLRISGPGLIAGTRDADAGADPRERIRISPAQGCNDVVAKPDDGAFTRRIDQQDRELVAVEPCDHVGGLGGRRQLARDELQNLVALVMPAAIVDRPEVVEIDQQQHNVPALAEGRFELLGQHGAIEKTGQRVVLDEMIDGQHRNALGQRVAFKTGSAEARPAKLQARSCRAPRKIYGQGRQWSDAANVGVTRTI